MNRPTEVWRSNERRVWESSFSYRWARGEYVRSWSSSLGILSWPLRVDKWARNRLCPQVLKQQNQSKGVKSWKSASKRAKQRRKPTRQRPDEWACFVQPFVRVVDGTGGFLRSKTRKSKSCRKEHYEVFLSSWLVGSTARSFVCSRQRHVG